MIRLITDLLYFQFTNIANNYCDKQETIYLAFAVAARCLLGLKYIVIIFFLIYSTIFFPQQTRSWHNSGKLWSKLLLPKGKKCMFTCTCVYKSALGLLFFNGTPVGTWRVIYTESLCTMLNKFKTHEFMCIWMMFKCVFVCVRVCYMITSSKIGLLRAHQFS